MATRGHADAPTPDSASLLISIGGTRFARASTVSELPPEVTRVNSVPVITSRTGFLFVEFTAGEFCKSRERR